MAKIMNVAFEADMVDSSTAVAVFQWDTGVKVKTIGIPVDGVFEASFQVDGHMLSVSGVVEVEDDYLLISVPDSVLTRGREVIGYIHRIDSDSRYTQYRFHMAVIPRGRPGELKPTAGESSAIQSLIGQVTTLYDYVAKFKDVSADAEYGQLGVELDTTDDAAVFHFHLPHPEGEIDFELRDGQ